MLIGQNTCAGVSACVGSKIAPSNSAMNASRKVYQPSVKRSPGELKKYPRSVRTCWSENTTIRLPMISASTMASTVTTQDRLRRPDGRGSSGRPAAVGATDSSVVIDALPLAVG